MSSYWLAVILQPTASLARCSAASRRLVYHERSGHWNGTFLWFFRALLISFMSIISKMFCSFKKTCPPKRLRHWNGTFLWFFRALLISFMSIISKMFCSFKKTCPPKRLRHRNGTFLWFLRALLIYRMNPLICPWISTLPGDEFLACSCIN